MEHVEKFLLEKITNAIERKDELELQLIIVKKELATAQSAYQEFMKHKDN